MTGDEGEIVPASHMNFIIANQAVILPTYEASAGAMAALILYVLRMDQVIAEYREMSRAMLIAFILLANVTLILYDRLLNAMAVLYLKKLRPKLFKG